MANATANPMIVTLKVKLGSYWSADIELMDTSTLEDVHLAIQEAVDFDNDHLYAFFVARHERGPKRKEYGAEDGSIFSARIGHVLPLPPDSHLFYLFDYGDEWIFKILMSRKKPHPPVDAVEYPRVVKETGEKPIQYETEDDW